VDALRDALTSALEREGQSPESGRRVRLKWTSASAKGHTYQTNPMPENKVEEWLLQMARSVAGFKVLEVATVDKASAATKCHSRPRTRVNTSPPS
jgi:hypothetical protein